MTYTYTYTITTTNTATAVNGSTTIPAGTPTTLAVNAVAAATTTGVASARLVGSGSCVAHPRTDFEA